MSLNISGPALLNKLFIDNLKQSDNPTIVFISSIAGKHPYPGDMTYCLAKNGVSKLAEIFRIELFNSNVKVTEIRPASIATREDNPNMFHLKIDDMVNAVEWVFNMPSHCSIDLIEISEIRSRRFI
jgi:NADP-dependent 3-hydroxy acid dehydrogenase YdfG